MVGKRAYRYVGIAILLFLGISFFITVPVEISPGKTTVSSLLGLVILYNPFVLVVYIVIALFCLYKGFIGAIKLV